MGPDKQKHSLVLEKVHKLMVMLAFPGHIPRGFLIVMKDS